MSRVAMSIVRVLFKRLVLFPVLSFEFQEPLLKTEISWNDNYRTLASTNSKRTSRGRYRMEENGQLIPSFYRRYWQVGGFQGLKMSWLWVVNNPFEGQLRPGLLKFNPSGIIQETFPQSFCKDIANTSESVRTHYTVSRWLIVPDVNKRWFILSRVFVAHTALFAQSAGIWMLFTYVSTHV